MADVRGIIQIQNARRPVLLSLFLRPAAKYGEVTKYVAGARKSGASAKATI